MSVKNNKSQVESDKDVFSQEEIEELEILDDDYKPKKIEIRLPDLRKSARKLRRFLMKSGRTLGAVFSTIAGAFAALGSLIKRGAKNSGPYLAKAVKFVKKHRYYFIAGGIALCAVIVLLVAFTGRRGGKASVADPMAGLQKKFEVNKHKDVNRLIDSYHLAYADGDIDEIQTLAKPVSDAEESYIRFFSGYIDGYDNIDCYTKQGLDEGSYLVSVTVDMKFVDINTPAQGLEFFYVRSDDDGSLYIDNLYSSFNSANGELEQDASVRALIDAYEASDDVQALAAKVEEQCAKALESDASLEKFVNVTLQQEISNWAVEYVAAVQSDRLSAIEGMIADSEKDGTEGEDDEPQLSTEEAIAKAQEEDEAELEDVKTNASNVNVRKEADKNSEKLGTLEKGTQMIRYSYSENGWSKIDFNGTQAYVRSEYLDVVTPEGEPAPETEADGALEAEDSPIKAGDVIEIDDSINVRSKADQSSDKVGVAHPGDKVTVVMPLDNDWTKVKWNGKQGYIKTEFLER